MAQMGGVWRRGGLSLFGMTRETCVTRRGRRAFRSSASVARSRAVARCRGARVFVRVIWREPIHVGGKPARALRPGHDRRRRDLLPKECANRRVDDPAGRGTARRVAWGGRGETHLAERGGDAERRRGFQRALNHEHRVCASRAARSVSTPPTPNRREPTFRQARENAYILFSLILSQTLCKV